MAEDPSPISEGEVFSQIARAIQLVFDLDVTSCEETGDIDSLYSTTRSVLNEVLEILGPLSSGELFSRDDAPQNDEVALSDLVFMGYMSVVAKVRALDESPRSSDAWEAMEICSASRREALRTLCAIGNSLAARQGSGSYDAFLYDEAMQGVETRRAYVKFRDEILRVEPLCATDALPSIRRCATAIAKLIGKPCYAFLRTQDRILLRQAQRRLLRWLADQASSGDEISAKRIWQDLANQCEIMLAINHRPELKEHDRRTLAKASRTLAALPDGADLQPVLALLSSVVGRCHELDRTLQHPRVDRVQLNLAVDRCLRSVDSPTADANRISTWVPPPQDSPASSRWRVR